MQLQMSEGVLLVQMDLGDKNISMVITFITLYTCTKYDDPCIVPLL